MIETVFSTNWAGFDPLNEKKQTFQGIRHKDQAFKDKDLKLVLKDQDKDL